MLDKVYKKKTLITGHTGFKGSWLAIWLKELGADVVGYSLDPPSEPNNFEATKLLKLNCDKAHAGLNWHSALTIDECLQMTADWYKIFYAEPPRDSMYEICTQQIAEYVGGAKR